MKNIHTLRFNSMGSQMQVWLQHDHVSTAHQLLREVIRHFQLAETRFSRFLSYSELTEINRSTGEWVSVSTPMFDIMSQATLLAHQTDGLFDPTQLMALEDMGYGRSFNSGLMSQASSEPPYNRSSVYTFADIELDPLMQTIRCPTGLQLDLGGIGKGYTAETAVNLLKPHGPCLINAGGDVTAGDAPDGLPGWPVGIAKPGKGAQPEVGRIWLNNHTLATSGIDYRRWQQNGIPRHHIIDPRTAVSAQTDALTVSVVAKSACTAEAWATAALVVGVDIGLEMSTAVNLKAALINQAHQLFLTPQLRPQIQLCDEETAVNFSNSLQATSDKTDPVSKTCHPPHI